MKKILLTIFCLTIIITSFSQIEKADANYLKIIKEYTLNDDGSMDYHYTKELKLLTHFSFHRLYGETFIVYNTDYQELKINSAYTVMADGKMVVTPKNAFNEVLPRFSTNAPAFNNIRELVVTHTGTERNAIINLDYTIHSEKGYYPAMMADDVLSESSPVNELIIKVIIPESQTLNFSLLNFSGEPVLNNEKGRKIYTWTFKSIPANSKDNYQEADNKDEPRLIFSTAKDLEFVYNEFVSKPAFEFETNTSMNDAVNKITTAETDVLTIALQLQKLVSNDINNLNVPLKYTGFKCRTPIETWNSNQGTQLEKVLLLSALLQKANISAEPIVVIPDIFFDKEIGNLLSFKNFLVRIKPKGYDDIIISANHTDKQNLIYGLAENRILLLDKNVSGLKLFSVKPQKNKIEITGGLEFLNSDTLVGIVYTELYGVMNPYFTLYNESSKISSVFRGGISKNDFTSTKIEKLSQDICKAKLEFKKSNPTTKVNNYMSFKLPYANNGVDSWNMNLLPSERSVSLEIPQTIHEKYEYVIAFPDNFKPVIKVTNIEIKNNAGYLLIKVEQSSNEILVTREIELDKKIIETNNYNDFRKIMNTWNNSNYRKIIFKK